MTDEEWDNWRSLYKWPDTEDAREAATVLLGASTAWAIKEKEKDSLPERAFVLAANPRSIRDLQGEINLDPPYDLTTPEKFREWAEWMNPEKWWRDAWVKASQKALRELDDNFFIRIAEQIRNYKDEPTKVFNRNTKVGFKCLECFVFQHHCLPTVSQLRSRIDEVGEIQGVPELTDDMWRTIRDNLELSNKLPRSPRGKNVI